MTNQELIKNLLKEETKYSKYYLLIIEKAKLQNRKKVKKDNPDYIYYENHHILPKSIFPEYKNLKDNPWNGVLLTGREHNLCHALIWKHYKKLELKYEEIKMAFAFHRLQFGLSGRKRFKSKLYEMTKIKINKQIGETIKKANENRSEEDTLKIRKRMSEAKLNKSKEEKEKIQEKRRKSIENRSEEDKKRISENTRNGQLNMNKETKRKKIEKEIITKALKRDEYSLKMKQIYNNKSQEEKDEYSEKIKLSHKLMNDDVKKERSRKISYASKNKVVAINDKGERIKVDKSEFDNNIKLKGHTYGFTHCINIVTEEAEYVTIEEFNNNVNLIGNKSNKDIILIYDENNVLIHTCKWNFKKVCTYNNLPLVALKASYLNNGKPLYQTTSSKTKAKKLNYDNYIGWYAIKI